MINVINIKEKKCQKITLKMVCSEDETEILSPKGELICSVGRDEDSHSAAETVLKALGFNIEYLD